MLARTMSRPVSVHVKPQRKCESIGGKLLRLLQACLPRAESPCVMATGEAAGPLRYVWATEIALRAAPDVMAPELARLSRGTRVALRSDGAEPVAHRATAARRDVCIVLDGYWRDVVAQGRRGWVFDGCLSRYAPPCACSAEELAHAAQVFGAAGRQSMGARRKWVPAEQGGAGEIYWTKVDFQVAGKRVAMMGQGATDNLAIEGMPLTFNEALLWGLHFQCIRNDDAVSASVLAEQAGHHDRLRPAEVEAQVVHVQLGQAQ